MKALRGAAATFVVVAVTWLSACAPAPAPDTTAEARQAAGGWLAAQFDPTTKVIPSAFVPGTDDLGGTATAVASLRITGGGAAAASAALSALSGRVDEFVKDGLGADQPGPLARLILAVRSTGGEPRSFGGTDLVARLEATMLTSGPDLGRFGTQDATYDGAFRQGLALAALSVVSPRPTTITAGAGSVNELPAAAWLRDQECADGSWMPYRADLSAPCAFDPVTYASPDTNSTAMAVLGLRAVGASSPTDALGWLAGARNADGGWSFDGLPGSPTDPDSTGLVVAARRSAGTLPDEAAVSALTSFQLGASNPADQRGAFYYPYGTPSPSLLATNDAVVGLAPGAWPGVLVQ